MAYIDPTRTSPNNYRLLMENDAVRVLEMSLRAGEKDQQHSHQNETVYFITGSKVRIHLPGGESVGSADIKAIIVEDRRSPEP